MWVGEGSGPSRIGVPRGHVGTRGNSAESILT